MKKKLLSWQGILLMSVACASMQAAEVKVDFGSPAGPVKPVNAVGQPPLVGKLKQYVMFHYLKEAGIPYSRLHDVGGWLGGGLFVDIPNLFPNFDSDETDPKNYRFAYTDSLMKALDENHVEPFFRLGVTIENFAAWGYPPVNIHPPKDYAKWARICEHVIRHYTEGWADGFKMKIKYWEIWNEPENHPDVEVNPMWRGDWDSFIRFYGTVAPYLKAKFPHLKIGGYGHCGFYAGVGSDNVPAANSSPRTLYFVECSRRFLAAVRDNKWPLDFFSYHSYSPPAEALRQVRFADEHLNEYGFTADKCERIFNEWLPYVKHENLGSALQAAGVAAELIGLQNGPCDLACIYDARCGVGNYSPLFNPLTYEPHKAYYAFTAFNELRKRGNAVAVQVLGDTNLWAAAAIGKNDAAVMIANDSDRTIPLSCDFQGRTVAACRITDAARTDCPVPFPDAMPPRSFAIVILNGGEDLARWVDPFIGTAGTANCHPNACYPHGMVQAGPSSGTGEWKYCSGYQFEDKELFGFVQNAVCGTGCPDLGDIRIQPFVGEGENGRKTAAKADETAKPGSYSVRYPKQGIGAEVTASPHVAFYRFSFGAKKDAHLLVDLQWGHCDKSDVATHVVSCETSFPDDTTMTGHLHLKRWVERDCYFAVKFSRPIAGRKIVPRKDAREKGEWHELDFALADDETLLVKIALSRTSIAAAERNLAAEIPHWSFERAAAAARAAWNGFLSRCVIEGTEAQKTAFYTSMYRLGIAPNVISDAGEPPFYSTLSFWDTFRAAHPLYTILSPERVPGMIDSILKQGRKTGFMPIWCLWGVDNQCMIGTHSVPVVVDWFLKEGEKAKSAREYWLSAYGQIKETLTKEHRNRRKERWDLIDKYGYYPFDMIRGESVSRLLECAYDDWCAGMMAKRLDLADDAAFFFRRAANWRNVFDASTGFMRGKDSKGNWREPFNPFALGHGADTANDFTEGNAFQYTWHVLHDPQGLMDAFGGRDRFAARLDSLFRQPESVAGMGKVLDVTGLIGQYAHGNEPSHHVAYFYQYAGRPGRTAEVVREVCDRFYRNTPDGLSGNDDCGQMSAWYLFSAMGFYPFNPCGGEYVIGAPQVPKVEVKVRGADGGFNVFRVIAKNLSRENKYVKSVTLNGKPLDGFAIRHSDIARGGELVFEMCARDCIPAISRHR